MKTAKSASAQEPQRKNQKIELGTVVHMATLSIRGTNKIGVEKK